MIDEKEFQQRLQKIGELVRDLDSIADPASRAAAKNLVQLLMDMYSSGLERILGLLFQSGERGAALIDELAQDPLIGSLMVLHGLHPDDLQTRVELKLKQISSKLYKLGAEARLVSVDDGNIRLRVSLNGGHSCGSTGRTVQAALEEALYEAAPDLSSLTVEGLEQTPSSGFVGLEKLLAGNPAPPASRATFGTEGMD